MAVESTNLIRRKAKAQLWLSIFYHALKPVACDFPECYIAANLGSNI